MWITKEPFFLFGIINCTLNSLLAFQNLHSSKHLSVKNSFGEMLKEQICPEVISTT